MARDFQSTVDGDLVLSNGDLVIISGDRQLLQEALFRLKTTKGDWVLRPTVGADLEQFIGAPLNDATLVLIEKAVRDELSQIRGVTGLGVFAAPHGTEADQVVVGIEFNSTETPARKIQLSAGLDLRKGQVWARGALQ